MTDKSLQELKEDNARYEKFYSMMQMTYHPESDDIKTMKRMLDTTNEQIRLLEEKQGES